MRTIFSRLAGALLVATCSLGAHAADAPLKQVPAGEWVQLFNGRDLTGWTPKITRHELGENFADTYRVKDGVMQVRYDKYPATFDGQFGHLFYKTPYSYYRLVVEYRFVGEQANGGPGAWALRNSGAMFHSQDPKTMTRDQNFPISLEGQFLGGNSDGKPRPTMNVCSPGTELVFNGSLYPDHCLNSDSRTFDGEQWVRAEFLVLGAGQVIHYVNGEKVLEYALPQFGGGGVSKHDPAALPAGKLIEGGYIALQSESHPIDFRKVELLNLVGCLDPKASTYRDYYVKSDPAACKYAGAASAP